MGKFCRDHVAQVLCGYVAQSNQLQRDCHLLWELSHPHISLKGAQNHQMRASQTLHTANEHNTLKTRKVERYKKLRRQHCYIEEQFKEWN